MARQAVLCVTDTAISGKMDFEEKDFHFINRDLVDDKDDISMGLLFPQIIPSIAIQVGDKYLTYARNGNETRLHGSRSMTLGGHVDINDYKNDMFTTITDAAAREVYEEVGIVTWFSWTDFTNVIYMPVNDVSKVHVGLYSVLRVEESEVIHPSEEIHDIMFLTKEQLLENLDHYEEWSKYIIVNLI